MNELYANFQGYFQLYISRIKWVFLFAIIFMLLFCVVHRRGKTKYYGKRVIMFVCGFLWSLSCSFIFVMTLFNRHQRENMRFRLQPFYSYVISFTEGNAEILLQILINIAMFIPLGFLLPCCFKVYSKYRYIFITVIICSLSIELIQVFGGLGLFETDDVINNTLGASLGVLFYWAFSKVKKSLN